MISANLVLYTKFELITFFIHLIFTFNVINGKKRKVVPEKVHLKRSLLCVPMTSKAGLRQIRNTDDSKFQIFGNDFKNM